MLTVVRDSGRLAGGVLLLATALVRSACDAGNGFPDICDRPATSEPVDYRGGAVTDGVYRSSEWDGDLLHFPPGAYYRVHHQLGSVPLWIELYLSCERHGLADGSVAPAAGNQVELKQVDADSVTVLGGTCTEYWLLVVAGSAAQGG